MSRDRTGTWKCRRALERGRSKPLNRSTKIFGGWADSQFMRPWCCGWSAASKAPEKHLHHLASRRWREMGTKSNHWVVPQRGTTLGVTPQALGSEFNGWSDDPTCTGSEGETGSSAVKWGVVSWSLAECEPPHALPSALGYAQTCLKRQLLMAH